MLGRRRHTQALFGKPLEVGYSERRTVTRYAMKLQNEPNSVSLKPSCRELFFKNCAADKRGHKIYWTVDDWRSDRSTSRLVLQIRLFSSAFGCPMRAG
jgi:hypothetical protein